MNTDNKNIGNLSSKAWILPFENNIFTAISEYEIAHILAGRQRYTYVPHAPSWCQYVFVWCGQLITLFDLNTYINTAHSKKDITDFSSDDIICVVSYKDKNSIIQYGGLLLSSLPFIRQVTDDQMCDYPTDTDIDWSKLALSCFKDRDIGTIPVLDIPEIFL